jgi:hypothetical protein
MRTASPAECLDNPEFFTRAAILELLKRKHASRAPPDKLQDMRCPEEKSDGSAQEFIALPPRWMDCRTVMSNLRRYFSKIGRWTA